MHAFSFIFFFGLSSVSRLGWECSLDERLALINDELTSDGGGWEGGREVFDEPSRWVGGQSKKAELQYIY